MLLLSVTFRFMELVCQSFTLVSHLLSGFPSGSSLGLMPPPSSLVSLAVSQGAPIPIPSVSPLGLGHTPGASSALVPSSTIVSPGVMSPHPLPTLSIGQPQSGMILSPAAAPVPANLVQKIQSGQFVEMRDLMADNIALLNQLSDMQGSIPLPYSVASRTRLREVPSLVSWLYCFNTYIAVRTSDPVARDMLAYARLLVREALRHGGTGWLEYDRVFRRQIAVNPLLSWNTIEPGLQAATIISQGPSLGMFCTLCRECDHNAGQCALAPLQQQTATPQRTPPIVTTNNSPKQRPETLLRICVAWNKGTCKRSSCTFRHICATCQLSHKARDCVDTPPDSEYKNLAPPRKP